MMPPADSPSPALTARLREALMRYGDHDNECTRLQGKWLCSCGFSRLLDAGGLIEEAVDALLASEGPQTPDRCLECGGNPDVLYPHGGHLGHVRGCPTTWKRQEPQTPDPDEEGGS